MADEWEKYVVKPQDDWAQYEVKNTNINPSGRTFSPKDFLPQELAASPAKPMGFGFNPQEYMQESQSAFKLALEHPETLMGKAISPDAINKTVSSDYSDLYRRAGLPGSDSTSIQGQMIPQMAGLGLDIATRPSSYVLPRAFEKFNQTAVGQEFNKFLTKQRSFLNLGGKKTAQKIAEKADQGIDKVGEFMSSKYDDLFNELKTVKGTVAPDNILSAIDDVTNAYPTEEAGKLAQIKSRLLDLQKTGNKLNAEELLNLKQETRRLVPKSVWQGKVDPDALQSAKQDIYFKVNDALGSLGGEKYKNLSQEYRTFKESQRLIGKVFYNQGVPSNANLGKPIDIPQQRAMQAINSQLPSKEQFLTQFEAWRKGQLLREASKKAVGAALIGGVGYGGYRGIESLLK